MSDPDIEFFTDKLTYPDHVFYSDDLCDVKPQDLNYPRKRCKKQKYREPKCCRVEWHKSTERPYFTLDHDSHDDYYHHDRHSNYVRYYENVTRASRCRLKENWKKLISNQNFCDFTINSIDGGVLKLPSIILQTYIPYFQKLSIYQQTNSVLLDFSIDIISDVIKYAIFGLLHLTDWQCRRRSYDYYVEFFLACNYMGVMDFNLSSILGRHISGAATEDDQDEIVDLVELHGLININLAHLSKFPVDDEHIKSVLKNTSVYYGNVMTTKEYRINHFRNHYGYHRGYYEDFEKYLCELWHAFLDSKYDVCDSIFKQIFLDSFSPHPVNKFKPPIMQSCRLCLTEKYTCTRHQTRRGCRADRNRHRCRPRGYLDDHRPLRGGAHSDNKPYIFIPVSEDDSPFRISRLYISDKYLEYGPEYLIACDPDIITAHDYYQARAQWLKQKFPDLPIEPEQNNEDQSGSEYDGEEEEEYYGEV